MRPAWAQVLYKPYSTANPLLDNVTITISLYTIVFNCNHM